MKFKILFAQKLLSIVLVFFLLALSACSLPARSHSGLSIEMVNPHTSTYVWLLGHGPIQLSAIAAVDGGGATRMNFYANGRDAGSVEVSSSEKPAGFAHWTPPAAGEYLVQAEIIPGSPSTVSAISSPVRVCVLDAGTGTSASDSIMLWGYGYSGPCAIPPEYPVPAGTSTDVSIRATASPVSIGYDTYNCSSSVPPTTITFNATVDDPSGRVAFVTVSMESSSGTGTDPYFDAVFLAQTGGDHTGTRTYRGTTFDMSPALDVALAGGPGTLTWVARAIDRTVTIIARDEHTMLVGPCEPPVHPLTIASPTPTLITIIPAFTSTPASAKDCPPGTFFADQTHKCIPIQIQPTKPVGNNCSQYGDQKTCEANSCTWDSNANSCG